MLDPKLTSIVLLFIVIFASALGVVYSKHYSRTYFVELQQLRDRRDALQVDWGRLQLEQSTWGAHGRIEKIASEQLSMHLPANSVSIISQAIPGQTIPGKNMSQQNPVDSDGRGLTRPGSNRPGTNR